MTLSKENDFILVLLRLKGILETVTHSLDLIEALLPGLVVRDYRVECYQTTLVW
jgi:hypothetical protein